MDIGHPTKTFEFEPLDEPAEPIEAPVGEPSRDPEPVREPEPAST